MRLYQLPPRHLGLLLQPRLRQGLQLQAAEWCPLSSRGWQVAACTMIAWAVFITIRITLAAIGIAVAAAFDAALSAAVAATVAAAAVHPERPDRAQGQRAQRDGGAGAARL